MSLRRLFTDATRENRPSADIAKERLHLVLHDDKVRTRDAAKVDGVSMVMGQHFKLHIPRKDK